MKIISLLFMMFLVGCGEQIKHDARFNPIVAQFAKDAKTFGVDVDTSKVRISFDDIHAPTKILGFKIKIKSETDSAEAYCSYLKRDVHNEFGKAFSKTFNFKTYDYMVIKLDNGMRNKSVEYIESTVYHELGHCVLNLEHDDNEWIMNPGGVESLEAFRYFYVEELFLHQPMEIQAISKSDKNLDTSELVYQSDYAVFGKRMFYQLFYNHKNGEYFYNDDPSVASK
jgi:hypothetical protein